MTSTDKKGVNSKIYKSGIKIKDWPKKLEEVRRAVKRGKRLISGNLETRINY